MNLETKKSTNQPVIDMDMEDFDFKPLTSGLGFHQPKVTEVKPAFVETPVPKMPERKPVVRETAPVYQNDLALFYGQQAPTLSMPAEIAAEPKMKKARTYRLASSAERITAYLFDLSFVISCLMVIMTAMARAMDMDLIQAWSEYPHEITPLVVTLFCGIYLMYFSIFEKSSSSTMGKSIFRLKVMSIEETPVSFSMLLVRSIIMLANFVSLGLFSYFNLQNKVTNTKVVKAR